MPPANITSDLDLSNVQDDMPLSSIWRQVIKEIRAALNIVSMVVFIFFAFMLGFVGLIFSTAANGNSYAGFIAVVFAAVFFSVFGLGLFMTVAKKTRIILRASACAQANAFQFIKGLKDPAYPGVIFSTGDTRRAESVIEGNYKKHEFRIFNYSYMEGSGKNRSEHKNGVIMVKLPRKVPNVIFDSRANNFFGLSSLGATFKRSQRFSFEGDFNKHFDVYAPQDYGRDVLYFMTPELMGLLIDEASNYDMEVVDDSLFFYAPEFDFKKQQLEKIFLLVESIGGEFSENTIRYADERVGDKNINMIAAQGRRLKRGISWITVLAVLLYIMIRIGAEIADSQ